MYQYSAESRKYVLTAITSHIRGEAMSGQMPLTSGRGEAIHAIQTRPTCTTGKTAAQMTAHRVICSAPRAIGLLQDWRVSSRTAEIRVPAWPSPIQKTKCTMSSPHTTLLFSPSTPTPSAAMRQELHPMPHAASRALARNTHHHTGPSGLRTSASMVLTGTAAEETAGAGLVIICMGGSSLELT